MNYAIAYLMGILIVSVIYWFIHGKKFYTGPLIEADINEANSQVGRSSDDETSKKAEKSAS